MWSSITLESLRSQREQILDIARRHGAFSVKVFGSTARDERCEGSEVDFLVELDPGRSLMDLGGLLMDPQIFRRILLCSKYVPPGGRPDLNPLETGLALRWPALNGLQGHF
ncbi:MAG: nucleotidyltransferase domain-containing protein [Candidatus Eremiobacteraeota bacterium]|nr:nucleotidyltransferase domain-containing protein [Candidatus Eremiobacteraeota bacterium]